MMKVVKNKTQDKWSAIFFVSLGCELLRGSQSIVVKSTSSEVGLPGCELLTNFVILEKLLSSLLPFSCLLL